ncbi:MAG: hypothetical protein ACYS9V_14705 [Planctomycetota bacterium]|jgi:hypothetical protein
MPEVRALRLGYTNHLCYLTNIDFHRSNLEDYKYISLDKTHLLFLSITAAKPSSKSVEG